jgi:WD40 repeat protein/serine/threonine protein kinase
VSRSTDAITEPGAPREDPSFAYSRLWEEPQPPDLEAFLAGAGDLTPVQLAGVLEIDLWQRWQHGQRVPAEHYLQAYPAVEADPECAIRLVYAEYLQRERQGEAPPLPEYEQRFPALAARLKDQIALRRALAGTPWHESASPRREATASERDPEQPAAPPLPRVPGYEVQGELGRGGMGVVYRARHLRLKRLVALKMIWGRPGSPEELARFRGEAEAIACLQHPNIVQVFEVGDHEGLPYIALEYVAGGSLALQLAGTPLPPRQGADLVETLARAMHHAHEHGIIHRDLKPANVLLAVEGGGWGAEGERQKNPGEAPLPTHHPRPATLHPKITDFGLAKRLGMNPGRTQSGAILGTPSYMAPEQAAGKVHEIGPVTDVYALGVILYEVLTGRPPFAGDDPMTTFNQVLDLEPVPPCRLQPGVPRDLETICLKCLQKDRGRRYESAQKLADDLSRFGKGQPIRAKPAGMWERTAKWVRRHPSVAALLAAVVLTFTVAFVLVTWQWRQAAAAERDARQARIAEGEALQQTEAALAEARSALYFANITLADRAWRDGKTAEAEEFLDACPTDLRRWEWHYQKRRCLTDLRTLQPHPAPVNCVAFSADGKLVAAGCGDEMAPDVPGEIKVWNALTGQEVYTLRGHSCPVVSVALSPGGRLLASASDRVDVAGLLRGKVLPHRGEVLLWDLQTGREVRTLDGYAGVAFNPDGTLLAAAGLDGTVKLWQTATGQLLRSCSGHTGRVVTLAFSPDGRRLASTSMAASVQLRKGSATFRAELKTWDAATGREEATLLRTPVMITSADFSPDGWQLACSLADGSLKVFDVTTGRELRTLPGHKGGTTQVVYSPDGRLLASGGGDQMVRVWDPATGAAVRTLRGHRGPVSAVAFDPHPKNGVLRLVSGGQDRTVKFWDPVDRDPLTLRGHAGASAALAFHPDGRRLVVCGKDRTIRVWDTFAGRELATFPAGDVLRLAISPNGKHLVTAGGKLDQPERPGELILRDAETGRELVSLGGHTRILTAVAYSPDGRYLASASGIDAPKEDGEVKVWDAADGRCRMTLHPPGSVAGLAFSLDGDTLAVAAGDTTVRLIETATGRELHTLRGHVDRADRVAFSPRGSRLASGDLKGTVIVWDTNTGQEVRRLRAHADRIVSLAYSADGERLASLSHTPATGQAELKLWDASAGRQVLALPGQVTVAFSPDGCRLAAVGGTNIVQAKDVVVWDGTPLPKNP